MVIQTRQVLHLVADAPNNSMRYFIDGTNIPADVMATKIACGRLHRGQCDNLHLVIVETN